MLKRTKSTAHDARTGKQDPGAWMNVMTLLFACAVVPVAAAAVPPTPERAEGAPPARRASRLPRIKLPFVELPERRPQSAGVHRENSMHVMRPRSSLFLVLSVSNTGTGQRASL